MLKEAEFGPNLLRHWIDRAAERDPDKAYIVSVDDRRTISYGQLRRLTRQIATFLAERGIRTNDRIALLAGNSIEHLACYLGVMAYGATICTIHVEMNRGHLAQILPTLNPRLAVFDAGLGLDDILAKTSAPCLPLGSFDDDADAGFYKSVAACEPTDINLASTRPQDDACILFTSGTSARPKGVVLTFRELLANVEPTADGLGLTADDRIYDFRSFNWCSAQVLSALAPLSRGASLILGRKFTRSRFFQHVAEHGATIAAGNPTTINMLLNSDDPLNVEALASLRFVISSSAPLLSEDWRRFEQHFGIPSLKAMAAAKSAGSPPTRAPTGMSAPSASRRATTSSRSSMTADNRCRWETSGTSRWEALPTTTIAISRTTERSRSIVAGVCVPATSAFSTPTDTCISQGARRT